MRLFEFHQLTEMTDPAAGNLPSKYQIDPATGLGLNLPSQWTQSPYLYAVRNPDGQGYSAQIHIPQSFYNEYIDGMDTSKWRNLPASAIAPDSKDRTAIKVRFKDPRQAAWFGQQIMYGTEHSVNDYLLDYFDLKYGNGDGNLLKDLKSQVPEFTGPPINSSEEADYYKNNTEIEKDRLERQKAHDTANTVKKNEKELGGGYEARMAKIVKNEWNKWFGRMGPAVVKKKFGKELTMDQFDSILNNEIEQRGVAYFMDGGRGSVKPKNPSNVKF